MYKAKLSQADLLVAEYAQNRAEISAVTKKIKALTDWQREDKGVHLDGLRDEYLEHGDRWRGWAYAMELVHGQYDPDDQDDEYGLSAEQRELVDLLDKKAKLRVAAGNIKRRIFIEGRRIQQARS
ncbi:hypothetical protein RRX38_02700 [Pseudomonas sp. DTU_2021_1001937_2_SI_NGA_ILE_001]|uniref:hypothetical protein n=1 Tax=Pseudomonas sp. DTU_2021_1001937_2_SI_NGA_ILE_001 TaxID=3077589 RepID=UPI0028FC1AFC|nr:hypothetical protein [Pseudomonas sp. DTU_2021_1001937_2_SI_NGA_ILE_001]WNW10100.1 hypothetical protein RRX38_02700 [Pseudomonas sp. DTU_2021_1001937_2_SI_NGA_ILE_001]